ncbi:MAG: selenide, water dikinase SelD [Candidatus Marinimicrobia bacterium]|nr:selenide, water dikinase SelD [Candidatus Neomarinimicrobiota bacterium]
MVFDLPTGSNENLMVGFKSYEDAAVYRLSDEIALVQTADYITPMTDDPHLFGQLAAANALSDIYAMGAKPITALNLCNFPDKGIPNSIFKEILEGGAQKVLEAGAVIAGGHSIKDNELKYGLSVSGTIHPDKIVLNSGGKIGDLLILTKPIGTGALFNAVKNEAIDSQWLDAAIRRNSVLNKNASEAMIKHGANACTDVTGFGLLGHLYEMLSKLELTAEITSSGIPYFEKAFEAAEKGFRPGMSNSNMHSLRSTVKFDSAVSEADKWLLVDPQTSGGLMIFIEEEKAEALLNEIKSDDSPEAAVIGILTEQTDTKILVK